MDTEILLKNLPLRERLCTEANTSLLERLGQLVTLPKTACCLTPNLAAFYQVREDSIRQITRRHREELENDGYKVLSKKNLQEMPEISFKIPSRGLAIFPRKAVLRIGMLLRNSPVAQMLRSYLIRVEEKQNSSNGETTGLKKVASQLVGHAEEIGRQAEELTQHSYQLNQHASQLISHSKVIEMMVNEIYRTQDEVKTLKKEVKTQGSLLEQILEKSQIERLSEESITKVQVEFLKKEIEMKAINPKILKEFKSYFKITHFENLPKIKFVKALEWLSKID